MRRRPLIDRVDLPALEARHHNDEDGAPALPPAVLRLPNLRGYVTGNRTDHDDADGTLRTAEIVGLTEQ